MRKHPLLAFATAASTIPIALFGTAGTVSALTTHFSYATATTGATTVVSTTVRTARRHRRALVATAANKQVRHAATARAAARPLVKQSAKVKAFVPLGGVWAQLRKCESGGNYSENSGNGYYGAYQFALSTWSSLGLGGLPSQASPAIQDIAAIRLQTRAGWRSWPMCSWILNLS